MTTVNTHYTFHYSQPSEYKLSLDSVFLAREIFERTQDINFENFRILDVCAGSGIIGMDLLFHRRAQRLTLPQIADFIEVQNIYLPHYVENCKRLGPINTQMNFLNCNYDVLLEENFKSTYDLIIGNPPYFEPSQGKFSPSEFKNRCRFFIDSNLTNLLLGIKKSLKSKALAFLLLRDQRSHGIDIFDQLSKIDLEDLRLDLVGDIRGTFLVKITRL